MKANIMNKEDFYRAIEGKVEIIICPETGYETHIPKHPRVNYYSIDGRKMSFVTKDNPPTRLIKRSVITPMGDFESAAEAAEAHGKNVSFIYNSIASSAKSGKRTFRYG